MLVPAVEDMIKANTSRFIRSKHKVKRIGRNITTLDRMSGLVSNIDCTDIANLDDLHGFGVPMWECEIPLTDDGF